MDQLSIAPLRYELQGPLRSASVVHRRATGVSLRSLPITQDNCGRVLPFTLVHYIRNLLFRTQTYFEKKPQALLPLGHLFSVSFFSYLSRPGLRGRFLTVPCINCRPHFSTVVFATKILRKRSAPARMLACRAIISYLISSTLDF